MNTKYNILKELGEAYRTGEFDRIYKYLDDDCVWESQWRLDNEKRKDKVIEYYTNKAILFKESNSKFTYKIVKLHMFDKLGVFIRQEKEDGNVEVIIDVKFSDDNKILRIDLCEPTLFKYEEYKIKEQDKMRILFISDIHGITTNLHIIKEEKFDKLVVLGDLYYTGLNSNYTNKDINILYVKELLEEYKDKLICLRGNCDSEVDIKASDFPICNNLALIHVDNIDIYCTHGNEYSSEKNRKFDGIKGVLIYGHEHTPYIKNFGNIIYINVGLISLPRNSSGPSYCIYEDRTFTIYNINKEIIDKVEVL